MISSACAARAPSPKIDAHCSSRPSEKFAALEMPFAYPAKTGTEVGVSGIIVVDVVVGAGMELSLQGAMPGQATDVELQHMECTPSAPNVLPSQPLPYLGSTLSRA